MTDKQKYTSQTLLNFLARTFWLWILKSFYVVCLATYLEGCHSTPPPGNGTYKFPSILIYASDDNPALSTRQTKVRGSLLPNMTFHCVQYNYHELLITTTIYFLLSEKRGAFNPYSVHYLYVNSGFKLLRWSHYVQYNYRDLL